MRRVALCLAALLLAGCQGVSPYSSESPVTPPPPGETTATYPAAPQDFAQYRSWSWRALPSGSGVLVAEMVSQALDQRGLRPAPAGERGDLEISATVQRETRQHQVRDRIEPYGYYGHGIHRGGYYGGDRFGVIASRPLVRTYEEQVTAVRLQLFEAEGGQPIWSTRASSAGSNPDALREAIRRALADYPPR